MVLSKGMENQAVKQFQECLLAWNAGALPQHGADGDFGRETEEWVRRFQESLGLGDKDDDAGAFRLVLEGLESKGWVPCGYQFQLLLLRREMKQEKKE